MTRDDAEVTLFALATNGLTYYAPVYDPFFAATSWVNDTGTPYYTTSGMPDHLPHGMVQAN